jgi:hypothetical protein
MSKQSEERWFKVDLHIHTPASADYGEDDVSLLDVLREAENRSLDVIGLVDHNSVRGYEQLRLEMSRLTVLREAGQLSSEEEVIRAEFGRLLERILLLPGFELTTKEDLHLLALFHPETPAERLNALLLNLGIPMDRLREGLPGMRAEADVAAACALISQAGGMVIAAHIDAPHGLDTMKGEGILPRGLVALEVDSPPEKAPTGPLPFVWFSNAHCLRGRQQGGRLWGVGERYSEVFLEACSFEALRDLLTGGEHERVRFPERERLWAHVEHLRQEGPERFILCGADDDPMLLYRDVAALANAGGGVLLIGVTGEDVVGVEDPEKWSAALLRSARERIDPAPHLNLELQHHGGKEIIRAEVIVEAGPPYVSHEGIVYVREGDETRPATRQELVGLVSGDAGPGPVTSEGFDLPQAGVAIVGARLRDGIWFYDVRDLRVTPGVTRQRAKGLWAYAIERHEALRQGRADLCKALGKAASGGPTTAGNEGCSTSYTGTPAVAWTTSSTGYLNGA